MGVSMVSGDRMYVRACVQVWVCVHGLISLGSFEWEVEVVDGGMSSSVRPSSEKNQEVRPDGPRIK